MKKVTTVLLTVLSVCMHAYSKETPLLFTAPVQGNVQLLEAGKHSYCIVNNVVYQIKKKGLVQKAIVSGSCNDAAVYNNNLVLATNNGIQLFDSKNNAITALLPGEVRGNISHIQIDKSNQIWFTKEYEGCFMIDSSNKIEQRVKVPATYALAYTNNGNMWVGTNVGLYKVPVQGGEIVRYAEEGIASNELPDNLVERLFADVQSNVWVIMPEYISLLAANSEEEFPDFELVGNKNNAVFDIATIGKAYLFATSQGILLVHDTHHGEALHTGEIHQRVNENAYLLTDLLTGMPEQLKDEAVTKIRTCGKKTYFITSKGLWSVNTAKFTKKLNSSFQL